MTDADFAARVDLEGGILAALDYGLTEDVLYAGTESPLHASWQSLRLAYEKFGPLMQAVQDVLDEVEEVAEEQDDSYDPDDEEITDGLG